MSGQDVALEIARTLTEDYRVFSRARVLEVGSRDDLREASKRYDFLMAVGLETLPKYEEVSRPGGMATLQIFGWFFGGIPSWFVPAVSYRTDSRLTVHVVDVNERLGPSGSRGAGQGDSEGSRRGVLHSVSSDWNGTSLWDRSEFTEEPGDYALSIIMPPMFILPDHHGLESASLTESIVDDLKEQLAMSLKDRLIQYEKERPLRAVFLDPGPGAELSGTQARFVLGIISEEGVPIRRLDVRRSVKGQPLFQWRASASDLDGINKKLSDAGRVSFAMPTGLPLGDGANTVQLRVLRSDGERLTRTVVYDNEEK